MLDDGKQVDPAIYLLVDRNGKVTAFTAVNVVAAKFLYEDENPEMYTKLKQEGTAAIADPSVNYCTGVGLGN